MNRWILFGIAWAGMMAAHGQPAAAEYLWSQPGRAAGLRSGVVETNEGRAALCLSVTNPAGATVTLLEIQSPPISNACYGLEGEVKYESVHGEGFLEMWSFFAPETIEAGEGRFFSRTLGETGSMAKLTGTSGWRRFVLPFDSTGAKGRPTHLEINLHLAGPGKVYIGPMKLVNYPGQRFGSWTAPGAWWSDQTAGLIGGIGGATVGCVASLLGWLASRGMARRLVSGLAWGLIAAGAVSLVGGLVALALRQPWGVWFPLLLGGVLLLGILPPRLRQFHRHYAELELRRMTAMDVGAG